MMIRNSDKSNNCDSLFKVGKPLFIHVNAKDKAFEIRAVAGFF